MSFCPLPENHMPAEEDIFITIHIQGAILPADLLRRIVTGDTSLGGLSPQDYHLGEGERLNDAINRSWNRLSGLWSHFRAASQALPDNDLGTTLTRERWLLPLFQELGYGRLQTARAIEIRRKSFPISHSWGNIPVHLVGSRVDLDVKKAGVAGAARSSPHSLVQELLNTSEAHLWAFVSNGLILRILRDNASLVRQAYVEFDLAAMFDNQAYADFVLLWLICHQSRVESERPEECWLERWSKDAQLHGARALEKLREGVEKAISVLGSGFLKHPANQALKDRLRVAALSTQDYYREILRLVYRLLFLFVAEDRDLLLAPGASEESRSRYIKYYSTSRLRRLADHLRGTRHTDLYQVFRFVTTRLGSDTGCPELGLPALDGFLFSKEAIPDLESCELSNMDMLDAVRALAFLSNESGRRPVDYKNLRSEELGSVYEALLELHPRLNTDAGTFELTTAAGHERKATGSYYTPESLVLCLLDSALHPVLEEACRKPNPEEAILQLKVCDPACGSGHFPIAAAHRIAKRLASIRTGDEEPAPSAMQKALRDVISHCIYGVDQNPMAVELCKVALWMESLEPGKPLSFLDHHIQCGNSLLGTTPALLKNGIPDEAFTPIEGDDKELCKAYKKQNKEERKGIQSLPFEQPGPWMQLGNLATAMMTLDTIADDTVGGVRDKQQRYEEFVKSSDYLYGRLLADAWCAAFVWKKSQDPALPYPITEGIFRKIECNPHSTPAWMKAEIQRLTQGYKFFHWHLAFPDVFPVPAPNESPENEQTGWSGGFDVILGNPPWERVNLEAKQFFSSTRPDIAAANTAERRRLIDALRIEQPDLYRAFQEAQRETACEIAFIQKSGLYPHLNQARLNTYVLFTELALANCSKAGYCGIIVPSGVATDDVSRSLFSAMMESKRIVSLFDFENREGIFPTVHRSYKFCLLTLTGRAIEKPATFSFFLQSTREISDRSKIFSLTAYELKLLSPLTGLSPTFRSSRDKKLVTEIYDRFHPMCVNQNDGTEWVKSDFLIMFRSDDSSDLYRSEDSLGLDGRSPRMLPNVNMQGVDFIPVWESKFIHQFDHRFGTFWKVTNEDRKKGNSVEVPEEQKEEVWIAWPRYWVPSENVETIFSQRDYSRSWMLGYRDITNATNERTAIAACLPKGGAAQPLNLFLPETINHAHLWLAGMNTFAMDYIVRQRIGGVHLNITTCRQLPIIGPVLINREWQKLIGDCVLELVATTPAMESYARDSGWNGPPFRWSESRRFMIRCELDALYFHLYSIRRDDLGYIMDTFPIVRCKDEERFGEYRTKRVILEIYDAMTEAICTGQPYRTRLNPQPGPPIHDLPDWPVGEPQPENWPAHIHSPRRN